MRLYKVRHTMKNIITSFAFVSMSGFYGNAMAFMISDDIEYAGIPRDLIMQIAAGNIATTKAERKLARRSARPEKIGKAFPQGRI